ncbi:MAG: response regulator [Candidatus Pacebacteria bacterium]|nr:response regulator [Candidatus Paceibacterota bacterium]
MSNNKNKILLIEDEHEMAQMYKDKFLESGFNIRVAFTVKDGLKKAKKETPDLIVLDILLSVDSGISFLKKMRQDPEIAEIPVVALSNYDEPKTKKQAFKLGVKNYLLKTNFTPKTLVEEIKKYLPSKN